MQQHQLLTINDLKTLPVEEKNRLVEVALGLSSTYFQFAGSETGFSFTVDVGAERERAPGIHASEISNCLRQPVYSVMNTERKASFNDKNMKMRFKIGHVVHAMVQSEWHRLADGSGGRILFVDEAHISPELGGPAEVWGIFSSCDGIITIRAKVNNTTWVDILRVGMEIKTESGPQFEALKSPRSSHLEQTCTYMATLDLPLMWIFYYNKSNCNFSQTQPPWLFEFDEGLWNSLEERFVLIHHYAETQQLPEREEGMYCSWCSFSWTCKPPRLKNKKRGTMPALKRGV